MEIGVMKMNVKTPEMVLREVFKGRTPKSDNSAFANAHTPEINE